MTQPTFPARRPRIAHLLRPAWRRPGFRVPFMLLVLVLALAGGSAPAAAHAPGFATALNDLSLLEGPGPAAAVLAIVPTGAEVELTGAAAGDLVEVIFAGQQGWAAAADLDAGHLTDGGIELATAITPTDLLLSPHPGAITLAVAPAGATLILTGAEVNGYLAAAYDGTGGWVLAADLE